MKYDKAIESISNENFTCDTCGQDKPQNEWASTMYGKKQCNTCFDKRYKAQLDNRKDWGKKDNWNTNEAFATTGGQYPSMEDDSDDYSFDMPASSPKYASKLKKNYHDNKTKDQTPLDDDAGNIGAVDEELKSNELNEWDKPDTLNQKPDKAPLDIDAEPQEQVEPTMAQESTGYKCRACGLYASSEDSANKHEDQFGKDHKMYYGDVYSKDEEALGGEGFTPDEYKDKFGKKMEPKWNEDLTDEEKEKRGITKDSYIHKQFGEAEQDKKYKCPDCKYGTEFPESFKIHARGQHDMPEDQINNIIGEVSLENMASDCGCDKGKEKFYKPIFESLGVDWGNEIDVTRADIGPADVGEMSDEDYKKYKAFLKKIGLGEAEDDTYCPVCGDKYNGDIEYYNHMKNKHPYRSQNLKKPSGEATLQPYWGGWKDKDATKGKYKEMEPDPEYSKKMKAKLDSITPGDHEDVQEAFIKEWDGMNVIQRHEWLNNKVGIFEMLDKYVGVSNLKFKNQDMASQERLLKLAESNIYSYNFKKKVNVEYYRDPADFPDPHPKSACDICKTQYQDHGDKGDKVSPSIKDEYDLNFDIWSHDWEGEGDYDDSDNEYDRRRDQELEDRHIGEARGGENGELEVYPGDYVDFGAYGKRYVINTDYFSSDGRTWWITDKEEDRRKSSASGWSISSSQAKRVIQSIDDADEESDEVFTYEEWLKNQASKSSLKAMRNSEDQPEKDSG